MDVFVTEGDGDGNFQYGDSWQKVVNLGTENNKYIQKLNSSNNFTLNVPRNVTGNYKIFYMFNKATFDKTMFAYDIFHTRNGNIFKVDIIAKNAIMYTKSTVNKFSVNNPIFISCSWVAFGGHIQTPNEFTMYLYENGVRKAYRGYRYYMWTTRNINIQTEPYIYHAKNDSNITIEYKGDTSGENLSLNDARLTYSYASKDDYTTTTVSDFEITALIVWGL